MTTEKEMKTCSECHKPLVREPTERDYNWERRKTCGSGCRFKRDNRIKRESISPILIPCTAFACENKFPKNGGKRYCSDKCAKQAKLDHNQVWIRQSRKRSKEMHIDKLIVTALGLPGEYRQTIGGA